MILCLSRQHAIQCRSRQSQAHPLQSTRQKGDCTLVTGWERVLNVWERNSIFLCLSSSIWQFIFIFLSCAMTSVENPLCQFSPTLWSQCPVVPIPVSVPRPQHIWGNVEHHGAWACPSRACAAASCPDGQGSGAETCFFPVQRCAWGPALQYNYRTQV